MLIDVILIKKCVFILTLVAESGYDRRKNWSVETPSVGSKMTVLKIFVNLKWNKWKF